MKYLVILFVLIPSLAFGGPFVVCDPQVDVTSHVYELDGVLLNNGDRIPAEADGSCKLDLGPLNLTSGVYTIRAKSCNDLWGCSDAFSLPLDFSKPVLQPATGLRLSP